MTLGMAIEKKVTVDWIGQSLNLWGGVGGHIAESIELEEPIELNAGSYSILVTDNQVGYYDSNGKLFSQSKIKK